MEHNITEEKYNFLSNIPWKYIIIGIIIVLIAFATLKIVVAIGEIGKPILDALGSIGKSAAKILNNCAVQSDCTKINNCSQCNNTTGCSCTADQKSCENISGQSAGSGGMFSLSCGLGIGFVIYLISGLLMSVLTLFAGWKASPQIEKLAKAEGTNDTKTLAKEIARETMAEVEKNKNEYEEKTGKELSKNAKNTVEKAIVESKLADRTFKSAQNLQSTQDKDILQKEATQRYSDKMNEVRKEISELSEEERSNVEDTIEEHKPSFVEEE